ncbi:MAG: cyclodeaminase/cyclohydrolase family protein [Firmicutes bacterium]|nr:cyclodeaminase/cyclohydrolase family protein [Bacillota bacterium]
MSLIKLDLNEFIEEIDSSKPAPGGGSVSAYAGTLGIALIRMVGHLSIGKKKYELLDDAIKLEFEHIIDDLKEFKTKLLSFVDEDTLAFNQMMLAYKMPKNSEDEIALRNIAIQSATTQGIETPLKVAKLSFAALTKLELIMQYGNKSALSDLGVGALMLSSSVEGALLNVKINLPGLKDKELVKIYNDEMEYLLLTTLKTKQEILNKIYKMMND